MKKLLSVSIVAIALAFNSHAQQTAGPGQPTVFEALQNTFDAFDTNSLMHANELNVTPLYKYNSESSSSGGALKIDWWVSDQQGAFLSYEEYGNRAAYWAVGYQARAVFKGLEFSLGAGTRQSTDDPFGDVKLFIAPAITKRIFAKGDWDIRIVLGADVLNAEKPNPFIGFTFRATKF